MERELEANKRAVADQARTNALSVLQRRRDSWAKEIGQNNEWSHLAPQFVREIDEQIEALRLELTR